MAQSTTTAAHPGPALNGRQLRLWQDLLEKRTGVQVVRRQENGIRTQIVRRMAEAGWTDADYYFRSLDTASGAREWGVLLDRLLVKETRFFRHQPSHEFVRQRIASLASDLESPLWLWSAGCASGEEAYSLAVDAAEGFARARREDNYYVVATDISKDALAKARRAVYPGAEPSNLPAFLGRYFYSHGPNQVAVDESLKQRVAFYAQNLLDKDNRYLNQMDVIYCQNVLIYFKAWRRRELINYFRDCLKPGGCLVIGPGEIADWQPPQMVRLDVPGVQVYQKRSQP